MTTGAVIRERSSIDDFGALARLLRDRGQRFLAHAARPLRRDDAHAEQPLGGAQEIDAARDRPPAVAGLFEELEALEPLFLRMRRHVGVESPADHFEPEQRQPVLKSVQGYEVAIPGHGL